MTTYKDAGVDIEKGDKCSAIAYQAAKNTFIGRKGMIGEPVIDEGGFSGALDMGDYFLVQNDDGIGTKMLIAEKINKLDTMGTDLIAMVADDAVCIGAETISITNTLDVNKVDEEKITALMSGLETTALKHKIVIPGGEIAELGEMVNGYVWNATAVGIVAKDRIINGKNIKEGDHILGLKSAGFRSNGFSLVRHILKEKFGSDWYHEKYDAAMTWGEAVLAPSKIYTSLVLDLHGRYKEDSKAVLKGVAHITGGGIPGNINRVLKASGLGADIKNLPEPHPTMQKLIELGGIALEEAYKTWNMGVGMIIISNDLENIEETCKAHEIEMLNLGQVTLGEINLHL